MPDGGAGGSQTTKTEPWGPSEKYLLDLYSRAGARSNDQNGMTGLYGDPDYNRRVGNLGQLWGGNPTDIGAMYGLSPTVMNTGMRTGVAPLNEYDREAMRRTNDLSNMPLSSLYGGAEGAVSNLMNNGIGQAGRDAASTFQTLAGTGMGADGRTAMNMAQGLYKNPYGEYGKEVANDFRGVIDQGLGEQGRNAFAGLNKTASGAYLTPDSNPYLGAMADAANSRAVRQFNTQALPALTSQFSASGRYGAGAQQNVSNTAASDLQRNMLEANNNLYGSVYESERGRQENAIQGIGNLAQGEQGLRLNAMGGLNSLNQGAQSLRAQGAGLYGNLAQADTAARQSGATGLANVANMDAAIRGNAAGMAPGIAEAPFQALSNRIALQGQMGGQLRGIQNQLLGAGANNYADWQQDPYDRLSWFSNIMNGMPGGMGSTTMSSGGGGGFNAGGAMGGAMSGALMASMIPGAGIPLMIGGGLLGAGAGGFF